MSASTSQKSEGEFRSYAELLRQFREGNLDAFTTWFNVTFPNLCERCRAIARDKNDAENIAIEIEIELYFQIRAGGLDWIVDHSKFIAFATVIAKRMAIKSARRPNGRKRRCLLETDLPLDSLSLASIASEFEPLQNVDEVDFKAHLVDVVPENLQPVARLYLENHSAILIAGQVGASLSTVYRTINRLHEIWRDERM